jgi:hypothetical protein
MTAPMRYRIKKTAILTPEVSIDTIAADILSVGC